LIGKNTIDFISELEEGERETLDESDPEVSTIEERSRQVTVTISPMSGVILFVLFIGLLLGSVLLRRFQ
jgi:hypothetical protein